MAHLNRAAQMDTEERHIARFLELEHKLRREEVIHGDCPDFVLVVDGRRFSQLSARFMG